MTPTAAQPTRAAATPYARVRACTQGDLALLQESLPSRALPTSHESRYAEHRAGTATYLVALREGMAIGTLLVRWEGFETAAARAHLPDAAELRGLQVHRHHVRRGVARELVRNAERLAHARGLTEIALRVSVDNATAGRVYHRLGFADWDRGVVTSAWTYEDRTGVTHHESDTMTVLCKKVG